MSIYTILHLTLMGGATFFLAAAIATSRKKAGAVWLKKHRKLAIAGAAAGLAGVMVIFLYKSSMGYPHFISPHARGGLFTITIILITAVAGQLLASGRQFLRRPHRVMGYAAGIMAVVTSFFGVIRVLQITQII